MTEGGPATELAAVERKCVGIVQARTGSARLPGKVLRPVLGRLTVLDLLWERVRERDLPWWLATTERAEDDELAKKASSLGFEVFRGRTDDVLSRYEKIVELTDADLIVKVNGDNPTTGSESILALIEESIRSTEKSFMLADTGLTRHHPVGHIPQVFSREALNSIRAQIPVGEDFHKTHVTSILLENKTKQTQVRLGPAAEHLRWTVDNALDLRAISALFKGLDVPYSSATYADFLKVVARNPTETGLNFGERQKPIDQG